jgi:indole-3-glycerol phosphate synthase
MNFLEKILSSKREEIREKKSIIPESEMKKLIHATPTPISLKRAIQKAPGMVIIAEMKKASPSEGIICKQYDPNQIAISYAQNGATAISVLTDEKYFQGSLSHIAQIRSEIEIPILRKDFIIDPYQIFEARAHGADAILLIVAALDAIHLRELLSHTHTLGMDTLIEVHNRQDLETALEMGGKLIGINNRDLETFKIDLATTEQLARLVPEEITLVAESGIHTVDDACRMQQAGVDALLIGTQFMRQPSPGKALARFIEEFEKCSV